MHVWFAYVMSNIRPPNWATKLVHQNLILAFLEVDFGLRPFSKKSVSPSFARVKSPHITLNDGDNTPSSAPNYSTTNHQISTIQRLHIINNTLINQSRKFSVLSAVCVPSSQRRHHTIEIVHIHRTSLVLLGTMMAI